MVACDTPIPGPTLATMCLSCKTTEASAGLKNRKCPGSLEPGMAAVRPRVFLTCPAHRNPAPHLTPAQCDTALWTPARTTYRMYRVALVYGALEIRP